MNIQLVYAPAPREVHETALVLSDGDTVETALAQSGWTARFPEMQTNGVQWSIWGRTVGLDALLREGDRVEASRALRVDPKVARRERFKGQGARGAGLFAQRRPGSKAGY